MSTPYTGDVAGGALTNPKPAEGVRDVINIPDDGDADNSATVFQQQMQTCADWNAFNAVPQFKGITIDGYGVRTSNTTTLAQLRLDGYSAAGGNGDLPRILVKSPDGYNRWDVSHLGFPGGAVRTIVENWMSGSLTNTTEAFIDNPAWFITQGGSGTTGVVANNTPVGTYGGSNVFLSVGNTSGGWLSITSFSEPVSRTAANTWMSYEVKTDYAMTAIGNNGFTHVWGLSSSDDPINPSGSYCWFQKTASDTNWQCQTYNGTSTTTVDSGVAPIVYADVVSGASNIQRLKIELHGSTTAFGDVARFFINEVLVATITTNLPYRTPTPRLLYVGAGSKCTGTAAASSGSFVGTIEINNNKYPVVGAY